MRKIIVVTLLLALIPCTSGEPVMTASAGSSWDKLAYVNQTVKPFWGVMKALEQPGFTRECIGD